MLTIEQYKKLLFKEENALSDEQIKKRMDAEYKIVDVIFDKILAERNKEITVKPT